MSYKNILITGGLGFIGANFVNYFSKKYPAVNIVNLDLETYAADAKNIKVQKNYKHVKGDICDRALVTKLFDEYQFDGVIHFAAESHVDNSISSPGEFIQTNVVGTFNLLDTARSFWMDGPFKVKDNFKHARFHHISTDEVYGSLGETGLFTEETPYAPNSPYSASKASSDMIVRSYFHTYGMNVITTNCSNNYGPCQHKEKFIPVIIKNALAENKIPLYGDGKNIRDWLFVEDHCMAIDLVFEKGAVGEVYNVGGDNEKTNLEIIETILSKLDVIRPRKSGSYKELVEFVKDRPGHDRRYAIDATKIRENLGWSATRNFETGIEETINWYLESENA